MITFHRPLQRVCGNISTKKLEILIPIFPQQSLNRLTHLPPTFLHATLDTNSKFDKTSTTVLFSTSGTGKTRSLLDLLNKKFGMYSMYIIAPGVPYPKGRQNRKTLSRKIRTYFGHFVAMPPRIHPLYRKHSMLHHSRCQSPMSLSLVMQSCMRVSSCFFISGYTFPNT